MATWIGTANQELTIDLDDWHQIDNITKVHIYGRDATGDNKHKQFLGLGIIDHIDFKKGGSTYLEYINKFHMLEHILEHRRASGGSQHWLLPTDTWVTGEEVLFTSFDLTGRNRFLGHSIIAHEGSRNKLVKNEIILYNGSNTDANMTRLRVILESEHYIRINSATGVVTIA